MARRLAEGLGLHRGHSEGGTGLTASPRGVVWPQEPSPLPGSRPVRSGAVGPHVQPSHRLCGDSWTGDGHLCVSPGLREKLFSSLFWAKKRVQRRAPVSSQVDHLLGQVAVGSWALLKGPRSRRAQGRSQRALRAAAAAAEGLTQPAVWKG